MKRQRLKIYNNFPNSAIEAVIAEWIHKERDRRIIRYKLVDGYTFEHIAELEQMSPKRIQDIVYEAEDRLYKHIKIEY